MSIRKTGLERYIGWVDRKRAHWTRDPAWRYSAYHPNLIHNGRKPK